MLCVLRERSNPIFGEDLRNSYTFGATIFSSFFFCQPNADEDALILIHRRWVTPIDSLIGSLIDSFRQAAQEATMEWVVVDEVGIH